MQPTNRFILAILLTTFTTTAIADPWPQWRGPNRDGKSQETNLLKSWPENGPPLKWRIDDLGDGYATPSVENNRIYGAGYQGDDEVAWAVSATDGKIIWSTRTADAETSVGYGHGPRSTPTADGDSVYTLGAGGDLSCLDSASGAIRWQKNLKDDLDGRMMSGWGYSESILIDGERLLCSPGGSDGSVACLDKRTGKVLWRSKDLKDRAAYTSIIKETIGGTDQYLTLTGKTLAGIDPSTGKLLWRAKRSGKTAVVATPIYHENQIFVTSSYNVGCNLFDVTARNGRFKAKQRYANRNIKNHHGGAIRIGDHIFASSGPILVCLNLADGKVAWEKRSVGKGSLTYADGHLYLRSESGPIALIEANPKKYVEKGRFSQPDRSRRRAWAHPVISDGTLYIRDQGELFAYDIRQQ